MQTANPVGYLSEPTSGSGRGVLVLHAWWGLNETMRDFCRRLAEHGFVAFAPDLYHGQVTDTITGAEAMSNALDPHRAKGDVSAAARFLGARTRGDGPGLAVIGFSLGAFFALDLWAAASELVRSVVLFYGTGPCDFGRSRASFLGHFAENDPYEPASQVNDLEESLKRAGRPVTFHRYANTGHWFFESDRADAYHPMSAQLAWDRTVAFLTNTTAPGNQDPK